MSIVNKFDFYAWESLWQKWIHEIYGLEPGLVVKHDFRYLVGGTGDMPIQKKFFEGAKIKIVHWVGSDVSQAVSGEREFYNEPGTIHFCDWFNLQDELKTIGINARVVTHKAMNAPDKPLEPGGNKVCVYMPDTRKEFFHEDLMKEVMEKSGREFLWLNVWWKDKDNNSFNKDRVKKAFMECSHLLRTPEHDGFSHTSAEFIMAGRSVITTEERPFQDRVKLDVDDIIKNLNNKPYKCAPAFYRYWTAPERLIEALKDASRVRNYIL